MHVLPHVFAFGWTSLPMLGWLAVAAAPLLIHLLSRRKYREVPFAAMEYLLAAVQRQSRRLRLEQWLLLALRTLLIVLVVAAVAEPYTQRAGFAFSPSGHVHRVLVFDGSYSMAFRPNDKTRFDRAKEIAKQIVAQGTRGDAFTLVLMSASPRVVVGTAALERESIVEEIQNLRLPQTTADLSASIPAIRRLVENVAHDNPRLKRHEVYFLTDLQRITWAPKRSDATAEESLRQMGELAQRASLFVMDLGQPAAENLAITGLRTIDPLAVVGRDTAFEVRLKNFGRQPITGQTVDLLIDGHRIGRKQVDLAPEASTTVRFPYRFDQPGEHTVSAGATGDALDVDNHRFLIVTARQAIRALCIDGHPSSKPFGGAADYLAAALSPRGGTSSDAAVRAEVAGESALLDRALSDYDCLFLCDVAQFTASESHAIDEYLRGGGSVVFFLGEGVSTDRYQRELGVAGTPKGTVPSSSGRKPGQSPGSQILPARLGNVVDKPQYRLDPLDYRHPIAKAFRGRGETSLLTTPVFKYYKLLPPDDSRTKTVLALANGDPLVVERPVHRGRVMLVATSADPSWTALPLWPSFVPLVQEIAVWCAAGQMDQRNLTVGDTIETFWATSANETSATIQSPDGRDHSARLHSDGDGVLLSYDSTGQGGVYVAKLGPPVNRSRSFAVNVETAESDLAQADERELQSTWPGVPFLRRPAWQDLSPTSPDASPETGSRLHIGLLVGVLALLLVETLLAWRMGAV